MELRTAASPKDVKYYTTERLREEFLIDDLFKKGEIKLVPGKSALNIHGLASVGGGIVAAKIKV